MSPSRRAFLRTTGRIALLGGLTPPRLLAGPAPDIRPTHKGKTLVAVFLRGGIDGLNVIVPHGDPDYYRHRSSLAIARPSGNADSCRDLDGYFGLHPAALSLGSLFQNGCARALHAVGYAKNTRSHFEEQDTWETGVVGHTLSADGWLNRHLASSTGHGTIRAVAIGGNLPRILRGTAPAYAIRGLTDLAMPGLAGDPAILRAALETAYCTPPPSTPPSALHDLLSQTASATLEGTRQLEALAKQKYQPANGAQYANQAVATAFREAARLIKANLGTEVIQIDVGGWDTHNNQGGAYGSFANQLRDLSLALSAFHTDLGDAMKDVLVLTLSDFGRTVRQNGTHGTDHGWANCMIALGGSLARSDKPVLGDWPTLAPDQLYQNRDLKHTTDFRDVLAEAVSHHLGNPNHALIMPQHTPRHVGLV